MPLIAIPNGQVVLRCINYLLPSHQGSIGGLGIDTMKADDSWLTLVGVEPRMKPAPGVPFDWTTMPRLNLTRGQAVRSYTCSLCGYVELYDAITIDPATWAGT
jgi:hypothetical protein